MESDPRVFTVAELAARVRRTLEGELGSVTVRGEISNCRTAGSGHLYFTLKDDRAQLRAVLFKGDSFGLRFVPGDGLEVEAQGDLTVYEPRGDLQLIVRRMSPSGMGALMQAFERLKRRLAAEGLFDADRKRPLPSFPRTVALVTSTRGAAVRDLVHVMTRRWPLVRLVVVPVRVQGEGAAAEIAAALDRVGAWGGADVVIVGRGGGSLEDLWAFNEEAVARAVARCPVPVVSGVGHESDITIADLVADVRAATPSAAAEIVVPDEREVRDRFRAHRHRLIQAAEECLETRRRVVASLVRAYGFRRPGEFLRREQQRLDHCRFRLDRLIETRPGEARRALDRLGERLRREHPRPRIAGEADRVQNLGLRLHRSETRRRILLAERVGASERALRVMDPSHVLERGYCIARSGPAGPIVTRASDLVPGQGMTVQFRADRAKVTVLNTEAGGLVEPNAGEFPNES